MYKSGIVNRQIGVTNFIRVVILYPQTKGHVTTAHAQPQKFRLKSLNNDIGLFDFC